MCFMFFHSFIIKADEYSLNNKDKDSIKIEKYKIKSQQLKYNKPDSSKYYLDLAYELADSNNFKVFKGEILHRMGGSYYIKGQYDLALDYFTKGLEIYSEINDTRGLAVSYNNIAMIYNVYSNFEKTVNYHRLSIKLCEEIGDSLLLGTNYFNLGITYHEYKKHDSALIFANKAIEIYTKINKEDENTRVYNLKGNIYTETGNYDLAKNMFDKIINQKDTTNLWDYSFAHDGMAKLYYEKEDYKTSINYGKKALSLSKKLKTKWDIQSAALILSKSYKELDRYDSAYKYLMLNKIYNDSLINKEINSHIEYTELKNAQFKNDQLLQEKEIQQKKIEFKNQLMWLLGIGTIILLLLLILFLYKNHQKKVLSEKLKFINIQIRNNNKELLQLNTTKDLIFRVIAHDLMGPIGNVISFTDYINREYNSLSPEKTKEIIQKLNISIIQAYNLLDNLLHWAKVQMNESNTNVITFIPYKTVNRIVKTHESSMNEKNIGFTINVDEKMSINSDEVIFQILMRNLIANAIKFTNRGGEIHVSAKKFNDFVEFSVKDTGIGIEEKNLELLFDSKPSLSTRGTLGEKGSGIGLVLCKEFIGKLEGRIWAESKLGEGSSFYFTIPL
ncbi:MAG: hypothetical protein C0595_05100 [Marinilabiliales bacterium]|nr:MAG: hypothetical protein C0595_05100 [Marinilabiliales bacterium]